MHRLSLPLTCAALALVFQPPVALAHDYSRACCEPYSGGCGGSSLPNSCDNTDNMASEIASRLGNWSAGFSFRNGDVDPVDFQDEVKDASGNDDVVMDHVGDADLVVWSGHGTTTASDPDDTWSAWMGTPSPVNSDCDADTPQEMIFGEQGSDGYGGNGDAEFVIMDASCSTLLDERFDVWENFGPGIMGRVHQGMGFNDSPNDASQRLENFIERIDAGDSNGEAWLDAGRHCVLGVCENAPVAIAHGSDSTDANDRWDDESMASPDTDPPMWGGSYHWETVGSTGNDCNQ